MVQKIQRWNLQGAPRKAAVGVAMTFSWAEAHDCFCDHFQVLYPSMLDTCCGGASHRGRC